MIAFMKLLARNRLALAGGIVLSLVVLVALLVPVLPLKPPDVTNTAERFHRPFTEGHLLGTDHLGRDLLSRLLWGTRLSLAVGTAAAVVSAPLFSLPFRLPSMLDAETSVAPWPSSITCA